MTKGTTRETLDGISFEWFERIASVIRDGSFKFEPARRVMIPKPGKRERRPLGVGNPRDKIVQKGLRIVLEAIYEPKFYDCSHGFRPQRSTHSALRQLHLRSHHFTWVIQGDISKCFDTIPHRKIMDILKRRIICDKFLTMIQKSLKAGYRIPQTKNM